MKKQIIYSVLILSSVLFNPLTIQAQADEGFIHGTVTTIDDNVYTGAIRWGKEEVYWSDFFNSIKTSNDYLKYLSREDEEQLRDSESYWWEEWLNINIDIENYNARTHVFTCQFGDIKSLKIITKSKVDLELKNGHIYHLKGGSNDIGATIRVLDNDVGLIKLDWDRIYKVEFSETPEVLTEKFGDPLNGTVQTSLGSFTGLIQWDHDERVSTDELDGDIKDGDVSIKFGKIRSISKDGRGSLVVLHSGNEYYLTGSNDVNSQNRGIIVTVEGMGRVDFNWDEFRKVTFEENNLFSGNAYASYKTPNNLRGTVVPVGQNSVSGIIIFDLDEVWDIEILDGKDGGLEYSIPFKNIKKIIPKNYKYSNIELKNGENILLGEMQDVSDRNDGVLVFENKEDPVYFPWEKIEEIHFK